jgi:hypothetical protein
MPQGNYKFVNFKLSHPQSPAAIRVGISPKDSHDSIVEIAMNVFSWCKRTSVVFKHGGNILDVRYTALRHDMDISVHFFGEDNSVRWAFTQLSLFQPAQLHPGSLVKTSNGNSAGGVDLVGIESGYETDSSFEDPETPTPYSKDAITNILL